MSEQWRPVPGAPGYDVSDAGRVRSWWRVGGYPRIETQPQRLLKPGRHPAGYPYVNIRQDGRPQRSLKVHELVLAAFVGPKQPGQCCRHLDGDPTNNRVSNLAWGSIKENAEDMVKHGRSTAGERHPKAKLTGGAARKVYLANGTQSAIAARFGISQGQVSHIRTGKHWRNVTADLRGNDA